MYQDEPGPDSIPEEPVVQPANAPLSEPDGELPDLSDHQQRVEQVAYLLGRGYSSVKISYLVRRQYRISKTCAYNWIRSARELLVQSLNVDPLHLIADQCEFLHGIMSGEDRIVRFGPADDEGNQAERLVKGPTYQEKIAASAELSRLLGLHQPTKIALTDQAGAPISLHDLILQAESERKVQVIDDDFIDAQFARLPSPSGGNGEDREEKNRG